VRGGPDANGKRGFKRGIIARISESLAEEDSGMYKIVRKISDKAGLPPGSPVYVGEKRTEKVKITVIDYDEKNFEMLKIQSIEECFPYKKTPSITWINIDGLHEISNIEKMSECFGIHPLVVEDILNTDGRAKMDIFDEYIFLVVKMHTFDAETEEIDIEQVSIVFGRNFVITFQEREGDIFEAVRNRLKNGRGSIRKAGADYLAYALIDALVDSYFSVLEWIGEEIEDIEEELVANPAPETLRRIHFLKREMIYLRRSVWPLRETISSLERSESPLIKHSTGIYLRDLYDHTVQVIDCVETFRDMLSGMLDIYLSSISNRMNEVMKFLTIIGTIFIPLTFIAGVYGMNFEYMPGLKWHWGYFTVLAVMGVASMVLLAYFKRKKWL
jgi:magnesium transporter